MKRVVAAVWRSRAEGLEGAKERQSGAEKAQENRHLRCLSVQCMPRWVGQHREGERDAAQAARLKKRGEA